MREPQRKAHGDRDQRGDGLLGSSGRHGHAHGSQRNGQQSQSQQARDHRPAIGLGPRAQEPREGRCRCQHRERGQGSRQPLGQHEWRTPDRDGVEHLESPEPALLGQRAGGDHRNRHQQEEPGHRHERRERRLPPRRSSLRYRTASATWNTAPATYGSGVHHRPTSSLASSALEQPPRRRPRHDSAAAPTSRRKRSSKAAASVTASSATRRPPAITITRSHVAAASAIRWVEKSTAAPRVAAARIARGPARSARDRGPGWARRAPATRAVRAPLAQSRRVGVARVTAGPAAAAQVCAGRSPRALRRLPPDRRPSRRAISLR